MYVYKVLHHLSDNMKDKGLRVRVGLGLDLSLSLSLLGLVSFSLSFYFSQIWFSLLGIKQQPVGAFNVLPISMHSDHCSPKPSHQLVYKTLSSSLY